MVDNKFLKELEVDVQSPTSDLFKNFDLFKNLTYLRKLFKNFDFCEGLGEWFSSTLRLSCDITDFNACAICGLC